MTTLDRIIEMQRQNISDSEISIQLQNEGISPTEINDSFNQAKIKNAVSPTSIISTPEGMQPSMMSMGSMQKQIQTPTTAPRAQEAYQPQQFPQQQDEYYQQTRAPVTTPRIQETYQPQQQDEYYQQTPQAYQGQDYYEQQGSLGPETISEIAEQVVTEKLENYKANVGDIVSFKNQIQNKVEDIDDRLKRIESSIDKLQQAIIGKIGEFGESSAMIHKDLDNLHGTVAKLMNPLIDNINEIKRRSK
ncbi:MAG: hypothetical protein V1888_02335 [archaeon]